MVLCLYHLLELTSKIRRCPSHHRGLESKSRKSRNTWINRQIWPWSTEWSKTKAKFCQENALVITNTLFQQHKRRLYTWTSPDGQYWNQIDYIPFSQRWRSSIQSAKTRLGADCGLDHELLIAKCCVKMLYCMFAFTFIIFILSLMILCFSLHLSCYFLTYPVIF